MAHDNQDKFCKRVKELYQTFFTNVKVLDAGSLDINGNNRMYFDNSEYLGIDLGEGNNVDEVCAVEDLSIKEHGQFDTIISTEMLEHAKNWDEALENMYYLLKDGGLLLITCATDGRSEHGTTGNQEWASPFSNGYYKNISAEMFASVITPEMFDVYELNTDTVNSDLQFYGVKKTKRVNLKDLEKLAIAMQESEKIIELNLLEELNDIKNSASEYFPTMAISYELFAPMHKAAMTDLLIGDYVYLKLGYCSLGVRGKTFHLKVK